MAWRKLRKKFNEIFYYWYKRKSVKKKRFLQLFQLMKLKKSFEDSWEIKLSSIMPLDLNTDVIVQITFLNKHYFTFTLHIYSMDMKKPVFWFTNDYYKYFEQLSNQRAVAYKIFIMFTAFLNDISYTNVSNGVKDMTISYSHCENSSQ